MNEPNADAGDNAAAGESTPNPGMPHSVPPQYYAPPGMVPPPGAVTYAPPAAPPRRRGLSPLAIVGIVVGAVALIVVGFFVWLIGTLAFGTAQQNAQLRPATTHERQESASTVHDFLAALESRDAAKACELAGCDAKDSPFLSQQMLDASQDAAPITSIEVNPNAPQKSGDFFQVPARFSMGTETITQTYTVQHTSGGWRVTDAIAPWNTRQLAQFPSTVNGIRVGASQVELFPGTYKVDVGNPNFKIVTLASQIATSEPQTLRVLSDADQGDLDRMVPTLTDKAHALGGELVVQAFEQCAAEKTLTSSCGADLTAKDLSDAAAYNGKVHRTITPETTKLLQFFRTDFTPDTPTIQTSPETGYIELTVEDPKTPAAKQFTKSKPVKFPEIDYSGETPVVRWVK